MCDRATFFEHYQFEGLTFDDVRLRTGRKTAALLPHEVSITSRFSRNVPLNIPIVSAAMDTVTESRLARAMSLVGGLGIIHRGLSPKEQAAKVGRVKYYMNALLDRPICIRDTETVANVLKRRDDKRYSFRSFPVIDENGRLVGMMTGNDFDFCDTPDALIRDVMTQNLVTATAGTDFEEAYRIMRQYKHKALPIVDGDNHVIGLYTWSDLIRRLKNEAGTANLDERGQLRVGAAIGTGSETLERAELLIAERVDVIVVDTAHGDSQPVFETVRELKRRHPATDVVAGNISEPESCKRLLDLGVDGIKIGQGPGSICTTRIIAGVGGPQVTAVYWCARVAESYDVPLCADGGITNTGDIPIAIGAGAHCIMLGSMLAGCDEAPGDVVLYKGRQWKKYRGMGSKEAMMESSGARDRYQQNDAHPEDLVPEGVSSLVPYKGSVGAIIHQCVGGLRKGMGYVGAESIDEMRGIAEFIHLSAAGQRESHVHNVLITEEPPNYRQGEYR